MGKVLNQNELYSANQLIFNERRGAVEGITLEIFILSLAGALLLGYGLRFLYVRFVNRTARNRYNEILREAGKEAERIKKDAEFQVKDEILKKREEFEKETHEVRTELRSFQKMLAKREESIERKADLLGKRGRFLEDNERKLIKRQNRVKQREEELESLIEEEKKTLYGLSGLSRDEAIKILLDRVEKEVEEESGALINRIIEQAKTEADKKAKEIITVAIQRCSANHTAETVVSAIDIPNDEMKGRIIGREGRNIRAFEKETGVDVIVDDTPGVIVISGFDSVRREMARRAMEKLINDGRIHPARIEEVVSNTKKELEKAIQETGQQVCMEMNIHDLHPKIMNLLGRLKFRTSYGQNVLQHSMEVAYLASSIAGELRLDSQLAKRCGLLHDIGKAIDQEMEGGHPQIGADFAKRFDEPREVVNAIASHHEDVNSESIYGVIVQAADAISASRPGARRESLEKYIKRLEKLEEVANAFQGVENAFAIQAGREIRVIVNSAKIDDGLAIKVCRDIARKIEGELNYPGEVKVTLIRETRIVEYAR